jgi:hypothetical protein
MAFQSIVLRPACLFSQNACRFFDAFLPSQPPDWAETPGTDESFANRTAEYKSAHPDVTAKEASQRAKALETTIYNEATEIVSLIKATCRCAVCLL